jgi:hypothetical protein
MGLSPRLPDGGYFIWITLDKTDLDPNYDYEDRLDSSSFTWVTRRGVQDTHPDYANLADPATRVSLFIRSHSRDEFTYLGEMTHQSHYPFTAKDGRRQIRYLFELMHSVPDALLRQLYDEIGILEARANSGPEAGAKSSQAHYEHVGRRRSGKAAKRWRMKRIKVATTVGVAVIVERTAVTFELLNASVAPGLQRIFACQAASTR